MDTVGITATVTTDPCSELYPIAPGLLDRPTLPFQNSRPLDGATLPAEPTRRRIENLLFNDAASGGKPSWTTCRGGLSSAHVWRVAVGDEAYAVRACEPSDSTARREWMRQTLVSAHDAGLSFVASPVHTPLQIGSRAYEVSRWCPGQPVSELSRDEQAVSAAATGLARFHASLRQIEPLPAAPTNTFQRTRQRLVTDGEAIARQDYQPLNGRWPTIATLTERLPDACSRALARLKTLDKPNESIQPIHGDARPEHFLVEGGELTGLIDFDAMRNDTPLADLTRLAGELACGDASRRDQVVSAYETAAGQSVDRRAIAALDLGTATVSAMNWLAWLTDPRPARQWDSDLVQERLTAISARLLGA